MQIEPEDEAEANFSRRSVLHQARNCRYFSRDRLYVTFSTNTTALLMSYTGLWKKFGFTFPTSQCFLTYGFYSQERNLPEFIRALQGL